MKLTDLEIDCKLELLEKRLVDDYNKDINTMYADSMMEHIALVQAVMQARAWRKEFAASVTVTPHQVGSITAAAVEEKNMRRESFLGF